MKKLKLEELGRKSVEEFHAAPKLPVVIVLDSVRSMHNVGSVFRTADAFAVEAVCLCGITAQPPHREIEKTALGATESVDWVYFQDTKDAIKELKAKGYTICAIEQVENSISLVDFILNPDEKYALIFGNEVDGVEQDVIDQADLAIEIPQFGTKHSFNISVTAGIVLWDVFLKFRK